MTKSKTETDPTSDMKSPTCLAEVRDLWNQLETYRRIGRDITQMKGYEWMSDFVRGFEQDH